MRVAFIGNTCNNFYTLLKAFRKAGLDGTLYYDASLHPQTFPESEDPEIAHDRPDWIRPLTTHDIGPTPWRGPSPALLEEFSQYDLLHVEDIGLLWASQTGRPYFWHPYGFDFARFPTWSLRLKHYTLEHMRHHPGWLASAIRYRRAISGASFVHVGQWVEHNQKSYHLLEKLVGDRVRHLFLFIDMDKFRRDHEADVRTLLRANGVDIKVKGLVIFHPTRIMFTSSGEYSFGSDALLRVLKRFHDTGREFTFITIRKGNKDEERFAEIARKYGIADRIAWIPFQPRGELIPWYSACDVVTNEFGFGGLGSIALEAMSCGTALLTAIRTEHSDPTFFIPSFDTLPPVFFANTEDLALKELVACHDDPQLRRRRAEEGRRWMRRNCSADVLVPRFLDLYEQAVATPPPLQGPPAYPDPTPGQLRAVMLQIKAGNVPGALAALGEALDESPEHPLLLTTLADIMTNVGYEDVADQLRHDLRELGIH